ncbi:hypothetical protein Sjap_002923 [Stephania japonica]|uniref:Zinc finger PHD-type domain-containing protein n=1 Tax=Stephania japonica TaxID=461633 RepID=A0AAP0KMS8_9MAGN
MEFSDDDEGEFVAQSVTDYHFLDEKEVLVSFTVLPIQWGGDSDGILEPFEGQVFLRGTADNGLQKIFKQVIAWRFELVDEIPDISVFSKEKTWIRLEKPRKSFEYVIRGVLITLHCLGFVKKDSQISGRLLWENLRRVFSTYEVRPCEDDLKHHHLLISEAVKRYDVLSKSKFLLTLLENVRKRKTLIEHLHSPSSIKKSKFLVDEDEDDSDKDVCAICDNGGALVCCDGRCLRSFHGTEADGRKSKCESLGLSEAQLEGNFMCANCRYKQHQCYACGRLGSSDKNFRLEVFPCVSATCGHYYHPKCVAKLLHPNPRDEPSRQALQNKIGAGEPFTCPAHRCHACKKSENLDVKDLCFALCRRCPKAYHRRCLHRNIAFQSVKDQGIIRRAWDGLLPNRRVMIYCLKHDIDESLQTPVRNIIFPEGPEQTLNSLSRKRRIVKKKKFVRLENLCSENIVPKKRKHDLKGFDINDGSNRMPESLSGEGLDSKLNVVSKQPIINNHKQSKKLCAVDATVALIGEDGSLLEEPELVKCNPQNESSSKSEEHNMLLEKEECSSSSSLDSKLKEKLLALMRDVAPSVTSDVVKNHLVPSTCTFPSKALVDRTIGLGRVNNYVEAAQIALQMLEVGCSIEEAKAICGPECLNQLLDSRNKLKVYLAPFLHGTCYTSFGRHFTKVDKLKEIVDKLHWYVKNEDVIVDFCCGANDFSWLIKEKLYESGKNCYFKNYDIIQPKNDFDFEKRDWMSVRQAELPAGSKLIMGLSPPFGLKAALQTSSLTGLWSLNQSFSSLLCQKKLKG